ncbi:putative bifunctional diguanylate cyclase/phosphodiesterase [Saccharospirillum mangrovi]|uniref:putative bifunctional diguanylate cyclase/phosphodiesterase n=1 Tax=Saccharospirillum mangrovi TaxID=2161747 RepID=UPI0013B357A2|nr:EAL domain-containing protein [Saccharospirillum mangrovi]
MAISFRTRLLLIFLSLLGLTLSVTLWAVLRATDANARAGANRELAVAERVFDTLLTDNSRQLTDRTTLLAEDFGFKQAIATNEEGTIVSVLANHGDRVGADMIVLMSPDGEVLISTHDIDSELAELGDSIRQQQRPFSVLALAEDAPYQLVMVPVQAPQLIAWVGMGFIMDTALLDSFRDITGTNITLLYRAGESAPVQSFTTLNAELPVAELAGDFASVLDQATDQFGESGWLSRQGVLKDRDGQQLGMLLSVSLQEALAAYDGLRNQMLAIAAIALVLAALATALIAGGISRPISALVVAARRIGQGNYNQKVALHGNNEFAVLGDTLDSMQSAIQERERHILYQAQHDLLTGLPNRDQIGRLITERLAEEPIAPFGVILLQLSNFDDLSDVYGLSVMDAVLPQVASRLADTCRDLDKVGRIGTDEFLLLVDGLMEDGAVAEADRYLALFDDAFRHDSLEIKVEARLGMVFCPQQANDYEDLMRRCHLAISEARHLGHSVATYQDGQDERHLRRITVTNRLQQAIAEGGFQLMFQPQYSLEHQRMRSVEVLIRWNDPVLGRMFPDEFIPLAEQSGDITLITDWVFNESIRQMRRWQADGYPDLGISVNLSAKDILKDSFVDSLLARIQQHGLKGEELILEVTESAMMADTERALKNLKRLYDAGVELAMDDFGTGFSSLAQLKSMPVHELKIDKAFILNLATDADDQRIVKSTIEMALQLGLSVLAEGVEDQRSIALLEAMGCHCIQGYCLAKALPYEDLMAWLATFNREPESFLQA